MPQTRNTTHSSNTEPQKTTLEKPLPPHKKRPTDKDTHVRLEKKLKNALLERGYSPRLILESVATIIIRRHDARNGLKPDLELYPKRRLSRDKRLVSLEQDRILSPELLARFEKVQEKSRRLKKRAKKLKEEGII